MPIGVAALPIPSMLALIFIAIYFFAFCPALGNRKFIIGFNNLKANGESESLKRTVYSLVDSAVKN